MSWVDRGRDEGRFLKDIEVKDLQEQLDAVRDYLRDLTASSWCGLLVTFSACEPSRHLPAQLAHVGGWGQHETRTRPAHFSMASEISSACSYWSYVRSSWSP